MALCPRYVHLFHSRPAIQLPAVNLPTEPFSQKTPLPRFPPMPRMGGEAKQWPLSHRFFPQTLCNFVLQSNALPHKVCLVMQRQEAEEHLRIIRSLMEKATVYRAISAPTALVGGLLATVAGFALNVTSLAGPNRNMAFFGTWFAVLAITAFANALFIRNDARRRGDSFISPGMKMALIALLPSYFMAGVVSIVAVCLATSPFFMPYVVLPLAWIVLHGLGLLATTHFAPKSLVYLGWTFLLFGLFAFANTTIGFRIERELGLNEWQYGNILMAVTFGGFHLIYAACTWPRSSEKHAQ